MSDEKYLSTEESIIRWIMQPSALKETFMYTEDYRRRLLERYGHVFSNDKCKAEKDNE